MFRPCRMYAAIAGSLVTANKFLNFDQAELEVAYNSDCHYLFPTFGIFDNAHSGHALRVAACEAPRDLSVALISIARDYKDQRDSGQDLTSLRRQVQHAMDLRRHVFWSSIEATLPFLPALAVDPIDELRNSIDNELKFLCSEPMLHGWDESDVLLANVMIMASTVASAREHAQWSVAALDIARNVGDCQMEIELDKFQLSREQVLRGILGDLGAREKEMVMAEIGVYKATLSVYLMMEFPFLRYVGVDPYKYGEIEQNEYPEEKQLSDLNETECSLEELAQSSASKYQSINNFASYERATLLVNTSLEAATVIEPESLDFVFIDGDHSYRAVKDDLAAWEPLVKSSGIVAGHDFGSIDDVVHAVCEHRGMQKLHLGHDWVWFWQKD